VDIFYPSAGIVFSKDGVFQQPRDITSTNGIVSGEPTKQTLNRYPRARRRRALATIEPSYTDSPSCEALAGTVRPGPP